MDAESVWREQLAVQREVLARKNAAAIHLQVHARCCASDIISFFLLFCTTVHSVHLKIL